MELLDELWLSRHPYDVLFLSIIEGYTLKVSKVYNNRIFYMKDNKLLIEYYKEGNYAWINYELIWNVFETEFSLNYGQTKEIMKGLIDTHLKLQKTKPIHLSKSIVIEIENHLKLHGTIFNMNHNE